MTKSGAREKREIGEIDMQTDIQKFREITGSVLENENLNQDWLVVFNTMKEVLDECDESESIDEFRRLLDIRLEENRQTEIEETERERELRRKSGRRVDIITFVLMLAMLLLIFFLS